MTDMPIMIADLSMRCSVPLELADVVPMVNEVVTDGPTVAALGEATGALTVEPVATPVGAVTGVVPVTKPLETTTIVDCSAWTNLERERLCQQLDPHHQMKWHARLIPRHSHTVGDYYLGGLASKDSSEAEKVVSAAGPSTTRWRSTRSSSPEIVVDTMLLNRVEPGCILVPGSGSDGNQPGGAVILVSGKGWTYGIIEMVSASGTACASEVGPTADISLGYAQSQAVSKIAPLELLYW
jgi:hypothetical protein